MAFANLINHEMDFFEVGIFAAGAVCGVGKHGDFWSFASEVLESYGSIFDYGVELLFGWEFINAAVGEGEKLIAFLADETTRKIGRF